MKPRYLVAALVGMPVLAAAGILDMQEQSYLDAAKVTTPAVRQEQMFVGPKAPTGLGGLSFAPGGLTECQEATFYRVQAGLPEVFDRLAYRESRCQNDVNTWCCYGIWQIHKLWIPQLAVCNIYSIDDYFGDNPLDKQRNACAAKVVYEVQGPEAWDTY
jgi:hypothetical protein